MGKRKAQDRSFYEGELEFIRAEAAKGAARMGGFESYVHMQARFADLDGFTSIARDMRQCSPGARAPSGAGCDETSHYKAGG